MSERDSDLDPGLEAAFGDGDSVLSRLEETSGIVPRILLHEPAEDSGPVVKPGGNGGKPPRHLGPYQVVGEIARGGVGIVMKGRDVDLGRDVALKLLRPGLDEEPSLVQRFVEEAQIEGQLQHPGIVPVYGIGLESEGRPYFAMKLVKGETLSALLGKRKAPGEDRRRFLGVFEQIAHTVAYAHARHVIHRDLKPANVLVGAFGEVQVIDWGFAKVLPQGGVADERRAARPEPETTVVRTVRTGSEGSESQVGSVMGTPAYMPPEQSLGDVDHMDERSDVFSLGAILAEILTGKPPYVKEDGDVFRQAAGSKLDPCAARLDDCGADEALVAIAKRCLAPETTDRYREASEVAEAVGSHLASVEERAREAQVAAAEARVKAEEERKKKKLTLALAASILLLVVLGGGGAWWLEGQRRERVRSHVARVRAAMARAERKAGEAARAPVDELEPHETALAEARRAKEMADGGEIDETTRRDVESLLASVEEQVAAARVAKDRWEGDRAMVARLEAIRLDRADNFELAKADAAYGEAFAEHETDVESLTTDEAVARIAASSIRRELCEALDDWALVRAGRPVVDPATARRLTEIASRADPAPWRNRLRAAAVAQDAPRLLELADGADLEHETAGTLALLATALANAGEVERTVGFLSDAIRFHPDDFWLTFLLAQWGERVDDELGLRYYTAARALRSTNPEVLNRMGHLLHGLGRMDEAIAAWRQAIPDAIYPAVLVMNINSVRVEMGELEAALAEQERHVRDRPDDPLVRFGLGDLLWRAGRYGPATETLRKALELDPELATAHTILGQILIARAEWDLALEAVTRWIELRPAESMAYLWLGRARGQNGRGDLEGAVEAYRKAISLAPDRGAYYSWLALALQNQKRFDEAIETLRQGIRRRPLLPWVLQANLARVLGTAGRELEARRAYDDAIREAERELGWRPNNVEALNAAADAWADRAYLSDTPVEDMRRCLEKARAVIELGLHDGGKAHHLFAHACWFLGREDEVVEACRESLRQGGHCLGCRTNLHYWLGRAARRRGDFEEAIGQYRQTLFGDPWRQGELGFALLGHGEMDEATKHLLKFHERATYDEGRAYPRETWEEDVRAFVDCAGRLPEILEGRGVPEAPRDLVRLAHVCYQLARPRAAARFMKLGLDAEPELAAGVSWYTGCWSLGADAAAYAGQAAAGRGLDGAEVDENERAELVRTGIGWLRAELPRVRTLAGGTDAERTYVRRNLRTWLRVTDFRALRDEEALELLPEAEQELCRTLWSEARSILASIPEDER